MKFILIDDDRHVLTGLQQIIEKHWPEHTISGLFESAEDALKFLQNECVDIVFTDIQMPTMTGLELIHKIKEIKPGTIVIVLSAYDNYSYVREALLSGALDYLLKPFDVSMLGSVIDKAVKEAVSNEDREKKQSVVQWLHQYRVTSHEMHIPDEYKKGSFFLGVLRVAGENNQETAKLALRDMALMLPEDTVTICGKKHTLFISPEFKPDPSWLERMDDYINHYQMSYGFPVWFSYMLCEGIHELSNSEKICHEMLDFLVFNKSGYIMDQVDYSRLISNQNLHTIDDYFDKRKLVFLILEHNPIQLNECINSAWAKLCMHYGFFQPNQLRNCIKRLIVELEIELKHYFKDFTIAVLNDSKTVTEYIDEFPDFPSLGKGLAALICSITISEENGKTIPTYILDAVRYIDENYMKPITLSEVSKYVFVNNWYLSAQFSKIMKIPLKEYINKVRINHAVTLLLSSNLKIYQVSTEVGFTDASYFSMVFKRFMGMTPREFQEQHSYNERVRKKQTSV